MSEQRAWKRPVPDRTFPKRGAGGFYRTADVPGKSQGIPLSSGNDALVAAVRLAYRVAEAQVDRSARVARRLRDSGDRVTGGDSARKSADAVERLVMKSILSALEWWETSVAQGRCPVKRVAAAEYRMVGNILGLGGARNQAPAYEEGPRRARRGPEAGAKRKLRIRLEDKRYAVREVRFELDSAKIDEKLVFHHKSGAQLSGELKLGAKATWLNLKFADAQAVPRGTWIAAICSDDGEQVGFLEVKL